MFADKDRTSNNMIHWDAAQEDCPNIRDIPRTWSKVCVAPPGLGPKTGALRVPDKTGAADKTFGQSDQPIGCVRHSGRRNR